MRDASTSTIAQLLFVKPPSLNFAHLVSELDSALSRCPSLSRSIIWDCDDVAMFDMDGARIVLSYAVDPRGGHCACLMASVGPAPDTAGIAATSPLLDRSEALCRLLTERVQARFEADAVLWHRADGPVTADMLDQMIDTLPRPSEIAARWVTPTRMRPSRSAPHEDAGLAANDTPDLPLPAVTELDEVRTALYPEGAPWLAPMDVPDRGATPMRLAVHAMNTTLIMVSLPVGAAMLTYSVLRGEDIRVTGRAMALTGAALAFSQSQMGQAVMAMI